MSFDFNSLYPNVIISCNISPDTLCRKDNRRIAGFRHGEESSVPGGAVRLPRRQVRRAVVDEALRLRSTGPFS